MQKPESAQVATRVGIDAILASTTIAAAITRTTTRNKSLAMECDKIMGDGDKE